MLGLLVMDTEMGDELRSVHSLSGGETFLVSLALALGLASMASSTLKIESLFIDEGFGSSIRSRCNWPWMHSTACRRRGARSR